MDKKEIARKHNLTVKLKNAVLSNDIDGVQQAAQEIFDADLEIEELQMTPALRTLAMNILIQSNWVPQPKLDS